jgi:hypothetical protein
MKFHHQRKQVSTCIILVLKEVKFLAFLALQRNYFMYVWGGLAVFVNKINNLATQSWKKILAFAS